MTNLKYNFKKIDWLRQLYHETIKWQHALKGQISWKGLDDAKDPNNGSKFTVGDLEQKLPPMLTSCLRGQQVPVEYVPEVKKCLAYINGQEKFDSVAVAEIVSTRKHAVSTYEMCRNLMALDNNDRKLAVGKLETNELQNILLIAQKLSLVDTAEVAAECPERETPKSFKLIDCYRHIYLSCQKWISERPGQVDWKKLPAKDPNNSKNGSRMKIDELKASLRVLIPQCIDNKIVPKKYMSELQLLNAEHETDVLSKKLAHEEKLRKVATKIEEVSKGLEAHFENVTQTVEPKKMVYIKTGIAILEKILRAHLGQMDEVELPNESVTKSHQKEDFEDLLVEDPVFIEQEQEDDGTNALMAILDQAGESEGPPCSAAILALDPHDPFPVLSFPLSPLSGSEGFSEVSSPPLSNISGGYVSDDSGICSPNPLNLEDPEALEDESLAMSIDLDFSELPDVSPYLSDTESSKDDLFDLWVPKPLSRKRKREEDFENTFAKKARP